METILIFIVGVVLGFLVALVFCKRKVGELEKEIVRIQKEIEKEREMFGGLNEFNKKLAEIKKERKEKIVAELSSKGEIQTNDAADSLDISKITAFRYLEELQQEGVIEQVGASGRAVKYKIKEKQG